MATALSTLTSLRVLRLGFQSCLSLPDRPSRRLPHPKRFVLSVLIELWFEGVSEYVDDLVARIDAPRLIKLDLAFFHQILFDTPELVQFICRTPALEAPEEARVIFMSSFAAIQLLSQAPDNGDLRVAILCENREWPYPWRLPSLEQVCTSCLPSLSNLEDLYISNHSRYTSNWQDYIESAKWLKLLQPFTTVKKLYLTQDFVQCIMSSLLEFVGERTTEVLPSLQNIFLEGLEMSGAVQEGIQQFFAMCQAGHPIAVSRWDRGSREADD